MSSMLIQRIHYEMKRMLAEKKALEFMWRQDWDRGHDTDMFTQVRRLGVYDESGESEKACKYATGSGQRAARSNW